MHVSCEALFKCGHRLVRGQRVRLISQCKDQRECDESLLGHRRNGFRPAVLRDIDGSALFEMGHSSFSIWAFSLFAKSGNCPNAIPHSRGTFCANVYDCPKNVRSKGAPVSVWKIWRSDISSTYALVCRNPMHNSPSGAMISLCRIF